MAPMKLEEHERPPLAEIEKYVIRKKKIYVFKISYKEVRKICQRNILKTPSWMKC